MNIKQYMTSFVAVLVFGLVLSVPMTVFADGDAPGKNFTVSVPTGGSGNNGYTSNYTPPSNSGSNQYTSNYDAGYCNGNYNCNSTNNVKSNSNYGNSYGNYGYGYGYGGYGGYDYGGGYGGNTYVLGLSYRGSDRTVINNTNTNTNVNNNGGYVPRHYIDYGDDDDNDDEDYDAPRCELDASDTSADDGDRITLEWNTDGDIDEAYINNGIGDVDEDGGDETIRVTRDVTFRMTVRGPGGSDSCSVTIRVDEDEDDDNDSNVVLLSEPTDNQLTSVYLSDLPYTGTEDTIVVGSIIATLLALMGGAWYFMFKKSLPAIAASGAMPIVPVLSQVMESTAVASDTGVVTVKHPATVDVHAFIEALIAENHAEAAEILEAEVAEGMSAKMFMIRAKNALNAVVQSRDGEFVSPDAKVLDMTAELSTDTIKAIVGTLGEAIIARTA